MARSVGSIEVTVNADTGKLTAQLRKGGTVAGEAGAKAINDELSDIGGRPLDRALVRMREKIEDALSGIEAEIAVEVNEAQLERQVTEIERALSGIEAEIEPEVNEAVLEGVTAEINEAVSNIDAEINPDPDMVAAAAARERLEAAFSGITANIGVDVDQSEAAAARAELGGIGEGGGRDAGTGFSHGFAGALADDSTLIAAAVLTMGKGITQGLEGLLSAATSVISSGISAIGSSAGAATPLVAGFAASIGTIVVGSRGFGDALGAISDEFAKAAEEGRAVNLGNKDVLKSLQNLSPQARAAAEAFGEIRGELTDVRKAVQDKLFAGMADVFRDLARTALPQAQKGMETLATTANVFGKQLAKIAEETDFEGIAKGLQPALDDAGDAAAALVRTVEPFLKAASPAAERLAEMIERAAEGMEAWVKANPDQIAKFLDEGLDSLELWGDLLVNVADVLGTIFSAGKDQGDAFIDTLGDIVARWDAFLESTEGQEALADFFRLGRDAILDMAPLMDGLKDAFQTLVSGDTLANWESLMQALGDAVPAVANIIALLSDLQIGEAFAEVITVLGQFAELLNLIPDDVLEVVGSFAVLAFAGLKIGSAIGKLKTAFEGLGKAGPIMLAISAGVAVALTAYDKFTTSNREAEAAAKAFTSELDSQIDKLIEVEGVMDGNKLVLDAFNESLKNQEGGEDFIKLLGKVGMGTDDSIKFLKDFEVNARDALTGAAESFGLPKEEAELLAATVRKTDDNFKEGSVWLAAYGDDLTAMSKRTGISEEKLTGLLQTMALLNDKGGEMGNNMEASAVGILEVAQGSDEATQKLLKQAEANIGVNDVYTNSLGLLAEFSHLQDVANQSTDDATQTEAIYGDALSNVQQAIADAAAAEQAKTDARIESLQASHDAWVEEEKLKDMTRDAAVAAADALGFNADLAQGLEDVGTAAHAAADEANAFKSVIDLLIAPAASVEQSFSDLQAAIDDFDLTMKGGQDAIDARKEAVEKLAEADKEAAAAQQARRAGDAEEAQRHAERAGALRAEAGELNNTAAALEGQAHSFDLATEAGREHREFLRSEADTTLNWAAGMIQAGTSADEVTAKVAISRATLEKQAEGFGLSTDEAAKYVDTLLGTPEFINTLIQTPGLVDALLNAKDLTLLYDAAGNPVITEFQNLGLDTSLANSAEFKTTLEQLGLIHAAPTLSLEGAQVAQGDIDSIQGAADVLSQTTATPGVDVDNRTAEQKLSDLQTGISTLAASTAAPSITLPFIDTNIKRVQTLHSEINNLPLTKTVVINVVTRGAIEGSTALRPIRGASMAGELITHPTTRSVGERGYREAIVPLDLPLNRVDPSVRELAALLRGDGGTLQVTGGKTITVNQTIQPLQADPAVVAAKVVNRMAAAAARM